MNDPNWQPRGPLIGACRSCLGSENEQWVRQLRSTILRTYTDQAITVSGTSCLGLCPGNQQVSVFVSIPGQPTIGAVLHADSDGQRHLLEQLHRHVAPTLK